MLKGQDILVILKLCLDSRSQTYAEMAESIGLSASETHAAFKRLILARLVEQEGKKVNHGVLCNFLIHGLPYAFPAHLGSPVLGVPTAWARPVLKGGAMETPAFSPVWPDAAGTVQGVAVKPLYASVPRAAGLNPELHDLLALVDILRLGKNPERRQAGEEIFKRVTQFASA